jgi:glycosyltransferase involved in cell wall biosynthesis
VVAFLSHSAARSGAELLIARVTAACTRIDPVVVLGEHGPLERVLADNGVRCVVVPLDPSVHQHSAHTRTAFLTKVVSTAGSVRVLARTLRELGVELVTTHSAKAHVYGGLAGRLARVPVVAHAHDVVGADGSSRVNTALLRTALATLPRLVIANSRTTAESLGRSRPVAVIGCPVAIPEEQVPARQEPTFTIGMVGRVTPWKGQDVVLRAFHAARSEGLAPSARLRLVGAPLFGADDAFDRELRALAEALGITDVVDFRGHRADVVAEMSACDVVVHASTRPEPFGQVVVEAMALGRAVIAADAGGPAEVITDGHDGLLVTPGDVDALASALVRLATDREARGRIADNGRRSATRYDLTRVVGQIETVLLSGMR